MCLSACNRHDLLVDSTLHPTVVHAIVAAAGGLDLDVLPQTQLEGGDDGTSFTKKCFPFRVSMLTDPSGFELRGTMALHIASILLTGYEDCQARSTY